jgi:hypothetical protein
LEVDKVWLGLQHEGATRNVDEAVWEELRNFKKCLVRMFSEQEKEVIFLETAMHLSRMRHHCVVECIPIPASFAKEAPLYFKKVSSHCLCQPMLKLLFPFLSWVTDM